jgi:hypothetical protein
LREFNGFKVKIANIFCGGCTLYLPTPLRVGVNTLFFVELRPN